MYLLISAFLFENTFVSFFFFFYLFYSEHIYISW